MPRGSSALVTATVVFFLGLALAITGVVLLRSDRGLGVACLAGGFVVVVAGGWVSARRRAQ